MPKKAISKEQAHKCIWVKKNSDLEIKVSEINNLIDPKINEFGVVIAGKYLNDDASLVELELISKSAQRVRANKIWVYEDTSIPYTELFDPEQLTNTKSKNGLISAGTLDIGGKTISLEFISKNAQNLRQEVWVYKGTSIPYTEPFNLNQLTNPERKNGLISTGTLDVGGNLILLEFISKTAQIKRTEVWVYKGTSIPYTNPFNLDQLTNVEHKNGLISAGTLSIDGESISLELISKNAQRERQEVWVYKGTSIPYTEPFDLKQLTNTKKKSGLITKGTLDVNGELILLELITKSTQRGRQEHWVYKGTNIPYIEPLDLQQLTNTKRRNGLISEGTLDIGGELILLELISRTAQRERQELWVYKGTSIPYTEAFDLDQLTNTKRKNDFISEGTLAVNGELISLELISKNAQILRKKLWVYKGTSIPYTELFDPDQLINPERKNGLISAGTLDIGGNSISIELITKGIQIQRQEVWVRKGTSTIYTEPFNLDQLTNTKRKNGLISAGTLNVNGELISLELISRNTQNARQKVWVYKGTSIPYTELFDPNQLTNTKNKNGLISAGTLDVNGELISLELISKTAQTKRTEIWVYKDTGIPYTKPFDPNQLTNPECKNGLISTGTLNIDGQAISLELISKNIQRNRLDVWVYKGTSIPYTEPFNLNQLTNTKRKNGLISEGTLDVGGDPIFLELVSKNALNLRQEVWVYKGTSIPYTEPFNLNQLTNPERKNGLISKGTLDVGGNPILLELISKSAKKYRSEVWVYKGTSIPYTEPFELDQLKNPEIKNGLISTGTLEVSDKIIQLEFITRTKKTHSKNSSSTQEAQTESINNNEVEFEEMDVDSMITPELMTMINQIDSAQSTYPALAIDEENSARPALKRKSHTFDPNPSKKISTFFDSHKNITKDVEAQNPSNKLSS